MMTSQWIVPLSPRSVKFDQNVADWILVTTIARMNKEKCLCLLIVSPLCFDAFVLNDDLLLGSQMQTRNKDFRLTRHAKIAWRHVRTKGQSIFQAMQVKFARDWHTSYLGRCRSNPRSGCPATRINLWHIRGFVDLALAKQGEIFAVPNVASTLHD